MHTGLDEIPGAKLKHALMGLVVGMYAAAGDNMDDVKIEPESKAPYLKVKVGDCKAEKKFYDKAWEIFALFAIEIVN